MDIAILVARIAAVCYLSVGLGLIMGAIERNSLIESFEKSPGLRLISGFFTVILGMLLVTYHNVWIADWTVVVTLIGWIAVIKGVAYILFPAPLFAMAKSMIKTERSWGVFVLLLGVFFTYFGFLN